MNSGNEWIRSLFKLWIKAGIICHVLGGAFAGDVRAGTVVLGWDHNTESDLAGYYLYSGPASGQYTQKIDVGLTNQYTVTQLFEATPYFFVVTAYNDSGLESDPSNEVYVFIPSPTNQPPAIEAPAVWGTAEDEVFATTLTVTDEDSAPEELIVWAVPRTPLVSSASLLVTGSGNTWDVQFAPVPNLYGTGAIDVFATDGVATNIATVYVTVQPVNDAPTLDTLPDLTLSDRAGWQTISLTGISGGALNEFQMLAITAFSSRPEVIPHPAVFYSSPARTGSLRFAPRPGIFGTATITVIVNDREARNPTSSRAFNVTVNPFKLIQVISTAEGVQFSWQSVPGCVYQVWAKPTLGETAWRAASPEITANGAVASWLAPADNAAEFYQVRFLR